MKLTQEQQDMLDGKYGKGTAYAMKIQVAIGECFDAKRMVPITRAHVARALLAKGLGPDLDHIFKKYLKYGILFLIPNYFSF